MKTLTLEYEQDIQTLTVIMPDSRRYRYQSVTPEMFELLTVVPGFVSLQLPKMIRPVTAL